MSVRNTWTLVIAGFVTLGLFVLAATNYAITQHFAEGGAYEWFASSYRNGLTTLNEQLIDRLTHDAMALSSEPEIAEAIAESDRAGLEGALDRIWVHRDPTEHWWLQHEDGRTWSSLSACESVDVGRALGDRTGGFVMCDGAMPLMIATAAPPEPRGWRLYVGHLLDESYARLVSQMSGTEVLLRGRDGVSAATLTDQKGATRVPELEDFSVSETVPDGPGQFGQATVRLPDYGGYRLGSEPVLVGASEFEAYVYERSVDTVDGAFPLRLVYLMPRSFMQQGARFSSLALAAASLILVAVLVSLASWLVRRFTRPLRQLSETAERIGYDDDVGEVAVERVGGGKEIDALAQAFGRMATRLTDLQRRATERADQAAERAEEIERAHRDLSEAHEQLKRTQGQLVEASRQAGMAEVATNVLHNVGNVLNSVNVSTTFLMRQQEGSKLSSLERAVALLPQEAEAMRHFVANDPRAVKLPALLELLTQSLRRDHDACEEELGVLTHSVEHLKNVIRNQQTMARGHGGTELVAPAEILDAALALQAMGPTAPEIEVVRDYALVGPVPLDRHRILQVLMNLLSNARHALRRRDVRAPRIVLRLARDGDELRFEVQDNGVGIDPAIGHRVFQHGFTTKVDGHGFGLHASANAATEMGGSLTMQSEGEGRGASFVLRVPVEAASRHAAA